MKETIIAEHVNLEPFIMKFHNFKMIEVGRVF